MIKLEAATSTQLRTCAKFAGLDQKFDIFDLHNQGLILRWLRRLGYTMIDDADLHFVRPVKGIAPLSDILGPTENVGSTTRDHRAKPLDDILRDDEK